jgi:hypothetical protein
VSKRHLLIIALKRVGAFKKQHNRRLGLTLGEHLTNTYDDLKRMGVDEDVALAGGLHSIYGTNAFRNQTLDAEKRPVIKGLFGEKAERLAWTFSQINRPKCFEGEAIKNWKTGDPIKVSEEDLKDLMLIEVANLRDNGAKLTNFPNLERFNEERQALT